MLTRGCRSYDLTRDAWDTHLMLGRYDLMFANHGEITGELTTSGQRFRKEPNDFDLDDAVLTKPGHAAVTAAVVAMRDDMLDGGT